MLLRLQCSLYSLLLLVVNVAISYVPVAEVTLLPSQSFQPPLGCMHAGACTFKGLVHTATRLPPPISAYPSKFKVVLWTRPFPEQ